MTDSPLVTEGTPEGTSRADVNADAQRLEVTSVVDAYHQAWTTGDIDRAMSHLSEDARALAPGDEVATKEGWRAYLAGFQPMLTAAPEHARMNSGNQVALWYYPQTATTSTALACELFTVRDGQITDIHLTFDRLSYTPPQQQTP